jgi:hypothetical protein
MFLDFMQSSIDKAYRCLASLISAGGTWSPFERLAMFKAFALSIPLYGAALIYVQFLLTPERQDITECFGLLDSFILKAVKWIVRKDSANNAERYLLGIPKTKVLLYHMALLLKCKLRDGDMVCPAKSSFDLAEPDMVNPFYDIKDLAHGLHLVRELPNHDGIDLKTLIRQHKLTSLFENTGALNAYSVRSARTNQGVCKTFCYKGEHSWDFVKWRINGYLSVNCLKCQNQRFNRQHYKCLIELHGEPDNKMFKTAKADYGSRGDIRKISYLDMALNEQMYDLFWNAISGNGWVRDRTKLTSQCDDNESGLVKDILDEDDELLSELDVIRDSVPVCDQELIDL